MSMAATATVVDPGVKLLAERLGSLSDRADWPGDRYGSLAADDAVAWLLTQTIDVYERVQDWTDVAIGETDIGAENNPELWLECPAELTDWLEERHENSRLLGAIKAVGQRWRTDIEITPQAFLSDLDGDELNELNEWVDSVHDTLASGGDLKANGGDLLIVPECLRTVVEPIPADEQAGGEASADSSASAAVDQQPPRAETPAEARQRLEEMLPIALRQLRDAESLAESRKKAHDAAKKNVDAMQDQLNSLVEELSEALTGVAGGDFQTRLPFDRVSQPEAGQPDPAAEKSDEPENATAGEDPILGCAIHLLTRDQLSSKTNGRSGDVGISDAIADKLGDAGIYTIGQLEALMREKGGSHWYRDLTGIGKGKAEDICNALEALRRVFPMVSE
jgi:hypothetical protein